ncbi:MAG: ATP-binding protein [Phyllobacterium sp.]
MFATLWFAGERGRSHAYETLTFRARNEADLNAALLQSVLEKQRSLPFVLSQDHDVLSALTSKNSAELHLIDKKLESLIEGTRASVIYLLDEKGLAVASSNWGEPQSFVGNWYDFRPYYTQAAENGSAEHYALGNTSKRPGLYISRRVDGLSGMLGVVVIKVEFDLVESAWRRSGNPSFATDNRGIVLVTSIPEWRFMTAHPVPQDRLASIRESLQFGEAPLSPLPIVAGPAQAKSEIVKARLPEATRDAEFLHIKTDVPTTMWQLNLLTPTAREVQTAMRESRITALFFVALLLSVAAFLLYRRQKGIQRAAEHQAARNELERRVTERTEALSSAHDQLQTQIDERLKTESKLQSVQQELVQANRLAILGQVAAGVAHEINQPVAAIRSYADNARTFLDRDNSAKANQNLESIGHLTDRIGTITDELRAFSRKGRIKAEPTNLGEVIDGALLLLGSRFRQKYGVIETSMPRGDLMVMGTRIRLEQILINLLQNALEAVEHQQEGRVHIDCVENPDMVELSVCDNGRGIAREIMEALFTPFNTSKGGGLGLVISKDIITEYGGRIDVDSSDSGTRFTVHMKKAP